MKPSPLLIDLAIAVLCGLVVVIVSPGVAIDAILALIVLAVCGIGAVISRWRARSAGNPLRRRRTTGKL